MISPHRDRTFLRAVRTQATQPANAARHELTILGTLRTVRVDTIVETIVMPLMELMELHSQL